MQPPPLLNNIPCCIVMDSSALMDTQWDMVELLSRLLPSSPHMIVIPEDVLAELRGLTSATSGTTASQAESVLKALSRYPDFSSLRKTPTTSKTATAAAATAATTSVAPRTRGVAVLQRPKETYYLLKKFARNRDTKIVACAYYFTVSDDYDGDAGEASRGPQRKFAYERAFFVTNDVVQQLKASPYRVPTIDTAALKLHWGHLGHWQQ